MQNAHYIYSKGFQFAYERIEGMSRVSTKTIFFTKPKIYRIQVVLNDEDIEQIHLCDFFHDQKEEIINTVNTTYTYRLESSRSSPLPKEAEITSPYQAFDITP